MFEKILDCPRCKKRFHYEHEGREFPSEILCPECGELSSYTEFTALVFCTGCRTKIGIPLDMLYDTGLVCPQCNASLTPDDFSEYETCANTIDGLSGKRSQRKSLLQPGEFFDKYRILKMLGRGGMAEVYLAEHLLLKQKCALKLMQQGLDQDDPIFIKRFVREAKLTHSFNQPNIVKVFDAGSDFQTGCLYLAMEYVEGKTLNELSCDRQLSEAELLEVLDSMAQALQTLADAKVVHRDIKPSNIMLTVDGVYKLMDLGIAKAESNTHAGEMTLTMDQTCIGTPGYASPEQCRAAHNVDIRSDIYSLGVTIYHVASGVMPFDGDTPVAIIIKVLQSEAEPLEKYRSDLSPQFISLIRRMMMKKPEDRPNSIEELRQLIHDVSCGKGVSTSREKAVAAGKEILAVTGKVLRTTGTLLRTGVQHLRQTQQFSPQEQKSFSAEKKPSFIWKVLTFLFKFAVGIVLAVVAGLHLIYVWMWYTNDQGGYISYAAFMRKVPEFTGAKRLLRESISRGREKTIEERLKPLHPLAQYPDALGNIYAMSRRINGIYRTSYPLVSYNTKLNVHTGFDFNSVPRYSNITDSMLANGVLRLTEATRPPHGSLKSFTSAVMIQLFWGANRDVTLSCNLRLRKGHHGALMRTDGIELLCRNDCLYMIIGNYVYKCLFKIPEEKWFNLTLSIDMRKRQITLLSGDRLLGSVLTVSQSGLSVHMLSFHSMFLNKHFEGEIDSIALCNTPLNITLRPGRRGEALFSDQRLPDFSPVPETYQSATNTSGRRSAPETSYSVTPATSSEVRAPAASFTRTPAAGFTRTPAAGFTRTPAAEVSSRTSAAVSTPEPAAASVSPQPVQAGKAEALLPVLKPWKSQKNRQITSDLDKQLETSRQNLKLYSEAVDQWKESLKDLPDSLPSEVKRKRRSIVSTAEELRKRWSRRVRYLEQRNSKIKAARNAQYSESANENIKRKLRDYTARRRDWGYNNSDIKFAAQFIREISDKKVDPNLTVTDSTYSYLNGPLLAYSVRGRIQRREEMQRVLIKRYADPTVLKAYYTPMDHLIEYGLPGVVLNSAFDSVLNVQPDRLELLALLFADGAFPNAGALSQAVGRKEYDLALFLLACGADPNALNREGETALFNAYRIDDGEKFRSLLLAAGAEPALVNRQGKKAADYAHIGQFVTAFRKNNQKAVIAALKSGISPDYLLPNGYTLLTEACSTGNVVMAKLLLEHNASAVRADARRNTPYQALFRSRGRQGRRAADKAVKTELVELLLAWGADPGDNTYYQLFYHTDINRTLPAFLKTDKKIHRNFWWRAQYHIGRLDDKNKELLFDRMPSESLRSSIFNMCSNRSRITPEILQKAFNRGLDPNASVTYNYSRNGQRTQERRTLLQALVTSNQSPMVVETALKAGADPNCKFSDGRSPVEAASSKVIRQLLKKYMSE